MEETQQSHLLALAKRMIPRNLHTGNSTHPAPPGQFFHLHHMKSGGTSLSAWIGCAKSRLEADGHKIIQHPQHQQESQQGHVRIPLTGLSECSWSSYHRCIEKEQDSCRQRIGSAAIMNYCSPLAVTNYFNWTHADAVTMMRHPGEKWWMFVLFLYIIYIYIYRLESCLPPVCTDIFLDQTNTVHRVWSMFRFQTNSCFKCTNLTQVYKDIDSSNVQKYGGGVCLAQLTNHITRNLLKNVNVHDLDGVQKEMDKREILEDAIDSIRNRFTVVGIMERLEESIDMFGFSLHG
jgi:hypothetical protein